MADAIAFEDADRDAAPRQLEGARHADDTASDDRYICPSVLFEDHRFSFGAAAPDSPERRAECT